MVFENSRGFNYVKSSNASVRHRNVGWHGISYGVTICGKEIKPNWRFANRSSLPECIKCGK